MANDCAMCVDSELLSHDVCVLLYGEPPTNIVTTSYLTEYDRAYVYIAVWEVKRDGETVGYLECETRKRSGAICYSAMGLRYGQWTEDFPTMAEAIDDLLRLLAA